MPINENGISRLVWSRKWIVNYIGMLTLRWSGACYNTMSIDNCLQKMLGHDSLHKGNKCEMETLVDLVVGNAEWPSGAWLAGSK